MPSIPRKIANNRDQQAVLNNSQSPQKSFCRRRDLVDRRIAKWPELKARRKIEKRLPSVAAREDRAILKL
jgi:hypothetical protein